MKQASRISSHSGRASVRANVAWTTISTLFFQVCQWLMLAILARLADAATVGSFSYALAATAPIILLANLNLRVVLSTDVRSEFAFTDYFTLRLFFLLISLVGVAASSMILCRTWREAALFIIVTGAKVFDAVSEIIYGLLQKYEYMKRVAVSLLTQGILQLLALYIGFQLTHDLLLTVLCWLLMSAATTLCYDFRSVSLIVREFPGEVAILSQRRLRSHVLPLFRQALPLAGMAVIGTLVVNTPIYLLNYWRSPTEVGIFSAQLRLAMVIGLAFTALGHVVIPRLARCFGADSARFWRLLYMMLAIAVANGLLCLLAALLCGGAMLRLLYGHEYEDVDLLVVLIAGAGLNLIAMSFSGAMLAARIYVEQFWSVVIQLAVTAGVSALLVPELGTSGAALGFLAGIGVYAALLASILFFRVGRATERRRFNLADPACSGLPKAAGQRDETVAETHA